VQIIKIRKKTVAEAKDRGPKANSFNYNLRAIKKDFHPKHRGYLIHHNYKMNCTISFI